MNEMNNEMMLATPANSLTGLTDTSSAFWSSIENDGSRATAVKIYNAVNKSGLKLDDHKGELLEIVDVVAHTVILPDEQTGEANECTRIVLIDKNGKTYESISLGVYSSLQKIFAIVGLPSWKSEPVRMKAFEQRTRKGYKLLSLELV